MLAPGNYVQWKSRIKRYIDTKPNSELIHHCLQNPPYTYQWAEKTVPVAKIILTGIDNDIYSTVDACPNACEMWKAIERLKPRYYSGSAEVLGFSVITARNMGMYPRECQKPKRVKDAAYHKEKMLLCKQEEAWELEAHYMYMAHIQEVTPDLVDNSGPIFDDEPMHKVQNNNDNYNVFAMENEHPDKPESE
ncbi:hypothetical protein Tco_0547582 [Tanacetum coccineum]